MHQKGAANHPIAKPFTIMYQLLLLLFIVNAAIGLDAQSISDSEFSWHRMDNCFLNRSTGEVFAKVEEDPILLQYSVKEFSDFVEDIVLKLELQEDGECTLKLKFLFELGRNLCLQEVGSKGVTLSQEQARKLSSQFNSIGNIEYGRQRSESVSCQAILYVSILKGGMKSIRTVNFQLK